jgi:hypothetical protein
MLDVEPGEHVACLCVLRLDIQQIDEGGAALVDGTGDVRQPPQCTGMARIGLQSSEQTLARFGSLTRLRELSRLLYQRIRVGRDLHGNQPFQKR